MPSLKRRFPYYAQAMRLYPKAYYRKYGVQTLQTLSDILDDPALSSMERAKLHARAWLDLGRSLVKQRVLASIRSFQRQPVAVTRRAVIVSLALVAPLIGTIVFYAIRPDVSAAPSGFWGGQLMVVLWVFVLPFLATLVALYTFCIWVMARGGVNTKRRRTYLVWCSAVSLIVIIGIGFLGLLSVAAMNGKQQRAEATAQSRAYQAWQPTLACTLLPEASAQLVMQPARIAMNNSANTGHDYSGIQESTEESRTTSCTYNSSDIADLGLIATVHEAFTPTAQAKLHSWLTDTSTATHTPTIRLGGYDGYYMQFPQSFSLQLWVKGYLLEVTAKDFSTANAAMQIMVTNLDKEIAAQAATREANEQRKIVPIPVSETTLSDQDKQAISNVLASRELQPAGTQFDVTFSTVAGKQVSGSFRYENDIHGTYTVQKQGEGWSIVSYEKQ